MKQYPKYKGCKFEWIGEFPEHWELLKLKSISKIVNGSTPESSKDEYWNGEIVWITPSDISKISNKYLSGSERKITEAGLNNCGTQLVPPNTLILTTRAPIGNIAISSIDLCFNQGCKGILIIGHNPVYFYYQLIVATSYLQALGTGTTFRELATDALKNFELVVPPVKEQNRISDYLEQKTHEISSLISQKQSLITLLKEERTAIINHAVTKGIDPKAKMKPSGVEWIGEIPEHWEVKKLKYVAKLKSGESIVSEQIKEDFRYPVYGGNGLRGYFDEYTHDGDYILIGRQGALCGNINYGKGKFWASEHAVVVNIIDGSNFRWLGELLRAMNLNQYSVAAAQPGLSVDAIQNLNIPFPPSSEQLKIDQVIQQSTNRIDNTVTGIQKEIVLLEEYKTSLINEVVTGKICVLNNAPVSPKKKAVLMKD